MEPEQRTTTVVQRVQQPIKVKLIRSSKGTYTWQLEVLDATPDGVLYILEFLDAELRSRYQAAQPTTEKEVMACQQ
jgi:hypothetical protein